MNKFRLLTFPILFFAFHLKAQFGTIKGIVKDENGGVPGTLILLDDSTSFLSTITEVNGSFTLRGVPEGEQKLRISSIGYDEKIIPFTSTSDEITNLGVITLASSTEQLGEVTVRVKLPGEMRAINLKKNSDKIVDLISADGIGKLPDRNAGEAVQRAPGVSIERDQGEGRFVSLRGLPSEWSSATINGDRIPAAEEETVTRSIAFDFFPTEMVDMVEVSKALTPDMEGDALGGSVNFITKTAPDKRTLNVSLGSGYNDKSNGGIYSGNILYGDRTKDGKFGFLLNGSYWQRAYATDNFEPRRSGTDGRGIRRLELRDYTGTRTTIGYNGAAEYNPNEKNKLYIRGMYGSLNDNELHYKHRLRFDKDRVEVQNIHNILITSFYSGEFGGEHELNGKTNLNWKLAHYANQFHYGDIPNDENESYWVVRFDQKNVGYTGLTEDAGNGKLYSYNEVDGGTSNVNRPDTHLPSDFAVDPDAATFAWAEKYEVFIRERDNIVGSFDITSQINNKFKFKAGGKFRDKERVAEFADLFYSWDPNAGPAPTLADMQTRVQPGAGDYLKEVDGNYSTIFSNVLTVDELDGFWDKYNNNLVLDTAESAMIENGGAIGRNFNVNERQISGYVMGTYKASKNLTFIGGIRNTLTTATVDGWEYNQDENKSTSVSRTNVYNSFLPMLHAKYSPDKSTNIRSAVTRSYSRPSFGSIAPGGAFSEHDLNYRAGNTELKPIHSWNFDLMFERYLGQVGQFSIGAFYKVIEDPIFTTRTTGVYNGLDGVEITRPENGDNAWLSGTEIGLIRKLDFLPGILKDFGVNANATYLNSGMKIQGREETVSIPRQAPHLYNLALFFENGKMQARIALNHKGAYIMEHGGDATSDEYFDSFTTMDLTASYKVAKKVMVFAEANNLLNQPMKYYMGTEDRPIQLEYYGFRGQVGVRCNLF